MASFNFVNTSQFRPFSYQEMLQPLAAYTQEYNAIEEGLGELGAKADVFRSLASQQNDPDTYRDYMKYANDLTEQANALSVHGLNASSRRKLIDMKRRYSSDIIPMEQSFTRRKELTDEQRKARLQDDTLIYDIDASTISLDDLIKDPSLSYKSVSGKNIRSAASQAAAAIAKEARKNPRAWRQILDGQYYEAMIQKGATSEEVLAAMQGDVKANPRLRKIMDDIVSSSGVMDWKGVKDKDGNLTEYGENLLSQVRDYAGQGLWSAIGETTYKELANQGWKAANTPATPPKYNEINPVNIYNAKQRSKEDKALSKYEDYFFEDNKGNKRLSAYGKTQIQKELDHYKLFSNLENSTQKTSLSGAGDALVNWTYNKLNNQFFKDLDLDKKATVEDFEKAYNKAYQDNREYKYDATKHTEFDYSMTEKDMKNIKTKINSALAGRELREVDFDEKSNKFTTNHKTLSSKDLNDDDLKISNIRMSPFGMTILTQNKEGEITRYKMPRGINTTAETNIDNHMRDAKQLQDDMKVLKADPRIFTDFDMAERYRKMQEEYKRIISESYNEVAKIFGTHEKEVQKHN